MRISMPADHADSWVSQQQRYQRLTSRETLDQKMLLAWLEAVVAAACLPAPALYRA